MNANARPDPSPSRLALEEYLPYRLSVASNAVSRLIARAYEDRFGLTIPEWRLLAVLAEAGSAAQRGLIAEHGSSWLLPRLVGPAHALDLLLSARTIGAATRVQIIADGRSNDVAPHWGLDPLAIPARAARQRALAAAERLLALLG